MELYQIECFREVANCENMTLAADKLFVSQSSLSKTIARLEKDLGVKLFDRVGTTLQLNGYGREFKITADKIHAMINNSTAKIQQMRKGSVGSVMFGSNISQFLDDLLENFSFLYPNISMRVSSGTADYLQRKLYDGTIDFILSTYDYGRRDIEVIPLFHEPMGVCMSKDHPLAGEKEIYIEQLRNENFVINNAISDRNNHTMRMCENAGFTPNILFEGPLPRVCGALVSENKGIMVICASRYNYMLKKGNPEFKELVHKNIADAGGIRTTSIQRLQNKQLTAAEELFIDYARENAEVAMNGKLERIFEAKHRHTT